MSLAGEANRGGGVRVEVRNLQGDPVPGEVIPLAVRAALALAGQSLDGLSVALVDAERMARLNRAHLHHEGPTDVISFPAEEGEEGRGGEIIICVPVAQEQAAERGHPLARELAVLAAHGTLHALGYADDTEAGRAEMEELQEEAAARAVGELMIDE
jgi:probable rRNA maturation factor